jgi:site-specific DNA-cytosine methylase
MQNANSLPPSSAVGAPHRRDRVWIIANPGGEQHKGGCAALSGEIAAELSRAAADADGNGQSRSSECDVGTEAEFEASWRHDTLRRGSRRASKDWWLSEPNVGRGFDGISVWLDRCVGKGLSYAESRRRAEILRGLWCDNVSKALWRAAGGLERVQAAEVLLSFVREYETGSDEARLLVESAEAPENFLRGLRERAVTRSTPHRSKHQEQRTGQYSDALQSMSRFLAFDGEEKWAPGSWEDAVARVDRGVPARVDRLRSLGNAVVPQVVEVIGRALAARQDMESAG